MSSTGQQHETTELVRKLGPWSSFFVCIGSVIGSGIFLVATDISSALNSPLAALSVWLVAGAISLAGALIFAELGTMYPRAGGQYVFLREAFHPLLAFLFGWTLIFVIQTGSIAAVAVAFAKFSGKFTTISETGLNVWASVIIVVLTIFNYLGIKRGAQFLDAVTSVKIVAIIGFIAYVFLFGPSESATSFSTDISGTTLSAYGVAMLAAFWAFDGWYSLTFVAGEIKDPEKNIPRAAAQGLFAVIALYILISYAYFKVLPVEQIAKSSNVAADAAQLVAGQWGADAMGILVIVSVIGCLNTMIISGARVIYAMAKDNVLPHALAVVHPKRHSPNRALTLQMVWSIALVWSGRYDQLFTYVIFAGFIFYGLTAYAVIWLRKTKPQQARPYKVPFYPWLPIFYVLFTIGFTVNSLIEKPKESLAGILIIAFGLPAYYFFKKRKLASH
jgi:basic amino acid/polyamine antiporter, APA family